MIQVDRYIIKCECCDLQISIETTRNFPSKINLEYIKAYLEQAGWSLNPIRKCWTCPICKGE